MSISRPDSDRLPPGDWSLAMGNPFSLAMDFTPTVTYGVVSGVKNKLQVAAAHVLPAQLLARQHTGMAEPGSGSR